MIPLPASPGFPHCTQDDETMDFRTAVTAAILSGWLIACQGPTPASYPQAAVSAPTQVQEREQEPPSPVESASTWSSEEGLEVLLRRAEVASPTVRAAFQRWKAARERIPQVQALPNPWVSLGGYVQSVETRTGPMDGRLGINQNVPWPGKLETAGDQAAAIAEGARMQVESARLAVRRRFLRDWTERVYLEQAETILGGQVALLEHIENVSLTLYEAGSVSQADALRAQVERLEMSDRLDTLLQLEAPLLAAMEASLGVPFEGETSWDTQTLLDQAHLPPEEELRQSLLANSPELLGLHALVAAAGEAQRLADLEGMPDFSIGADWTWIGQGNPTQAGSGDDALALTLAVEIPLQRGAIDGARSQALANRRQVLERRALRQWQLLADLQSALAAHEDAHRRITLFKDHLIPKAEQTYGATLAAYQAGQAAFQDMLDAARVVLEFRLSAARAAADAALAYADLNGLLPAPLLIAEGSVQ